MSKPRPLICGALLALALAAQAGVTLDTAPDTKLSDVIQTVQKQTGYRFFYDDAIVSKNANAVSLKDASLEEALKKLFAGTSITYTVKDKVIYLKTTDKASWKAAVSATQAAGQVKGTVLDPNGDPLMGVTVSVNGKNVAATDLDGNFTVKAKPGETLGFSYVGYAPAHVKVTGDDPVGITMSEDSKTLDEVVVTALGIKREAKSLSYNAQEIKSDELVQVKDANFINSLAGKVAGVNINASSSGIGGASKVVMRGSKSISGNNNALYVIDGIPMPNLETSQPEDLYTGMGQTGDGASMVNPEDIESMTVLSGAAASALYGSQAANGVILITTKKGQAGRVRVTYSNSTQFLKATATPDFQNTYGAETGDFKSWGAELATPSSYDPVDFFQTGYNETNALTLTAGNDRNQTFLSMAATNAEGIIENNTLDRYNFNLRNTTDLIKDKLRLDAGASYMSVKERNMVAQGQYMNPIVATYLMSPSYSLDTYKVFEMYDPSRGLKTQFWPWGNQGLGMQNPYWITNRDNFVNHKTRYMLNAGLYWDNVVKGLNISARAKVDQTNAIMEKKYAATTDAIFAEDKGAYFKGESTTRQIYADIMATYNNRWDKFDLNATAGASIEDVKYNYFYDGGDLLSVANHFSMMNINDNGTHTQRKSQGYHDQIQAAFATAGLGFNNMLYLDLTGRIEWPSQLGGAKKKSYAYGSVGLSAILTEMIPGLRTDWLSFLKIRGSYSEVGNSPLRFAATNWSTYEYVSGSPSTSTYYPNNDIEPERTKAWEVGLQSRFWMDKIVFNLSLYKTSTYNQLFSPSLSAASGYTGIQINGGQVDNKGLELSLGINQPLGMVQWSSNITYTLNRNKIVKLLKPTELADGLTVEQKLVDVATLGNVKSRLVEGGSIGDLFVTVLKRDMHGHIIVDDIEKTVSRDDNAGPNGDGWVYAGNSEPKYTLGWRNDFHWKGLSLGFLINGRFGGRVVSMTQAYMDAYGTSATSAAARAAGGVTLNNIFIAGSDQKFYEYVGNNIGENYIYKATNVRLAELTVGYDIPVNRWVNWIEGIHVAFVGRNLCYFYKKAPFDPELTASTSMGWSGMDYFMLPAMRTLGFTVKVNF